MERGLGWLAALAAVALVGCAEERKNMADAGARVEEAAKAVGEAARQVDVHKIGEAVKEMGGALADASLVDPVPHRTLREILPESLAGMKRASAKGSRTNAVGVSTSSVDGIYKDGKGGKLVLEIVDTGSFTGVASLTLNTIKVEIDREGDDGYERTLMVGGHKAFETYSSKKRRGERHIFVAGRFAVSLNATGVDEKTFRAAADEIDIAKVEALKTQGVRVSASAEKK